MADNQYATVNKFKKLLMFVAICMASILVLAPICASAADSIAAPIISLVRNFDDGIHVQWAGPEGVDEYYLYRSTDDGPFDEIAKLRDTSYTDKDVEPARKYSYKLKASKKNGFASITSNFSGKKSTYRVRSTEITTIENQTKAVKLEWKAVPEADGYKIYRKTGNDGDYKYLITKEGSANTSFANTTPLPGEMYSYLVKPYISPSGSNYYNYHDNSVDIFRLSKISDVYAENISGKQVRISWSPDENAETYVVSQKNLGDDRLKNYIASGDTSELTLSVVDYGEYSFTVRAYTDGYIGPFSEKSTVSVKGDVKTVEAVQPNSKSVYVNADLLSAIDGGTWAQNETLGKVTWDDGSFEYAPLLNIEPATAPESPGEFSVTVNFMVNGHDICSSQISLTAICNHDYVRSIEKSATCGADGIARYTCSCGSTYTSVLPATGDHQWDEGVITRRATETETGIRTYTCQVCGKTYTEEVAKIGHSYVLTNTYRAADGTRYDVYTCSNCGDTYTQNMGKVCPHTSGTRNEVTGRIVCNACHITLNSKNDFIQHTIDQMLYERERIEADPNWRNEYGVIHAGAYTYEQAQICNECGEVLTYAPAWGIR